MVRILGGTLYERAKPVGSVKKTYAESEISTMVLASLWG